MPADMKYLEREKHQADENLIACRNKVARAEIDLLAARRALREAEAEAEERSAAVQMHRQLATTYETGTSIGESIYVRADVAQVVAEPLIGSESGRTD